MSSTTTGGTTADRQRMRAARAAGTKNAGPASRLPSPPRQRRPALAAVAVLLIVGGALLAGLLAIRMDSRVPVLAAKGDIEPGTRIAKSDLQVVQVASEGLKLIGAEHESVVVGSYALARIPDGMLLDTRLLDEKDPIGVDRAIVSVVLSPALAPKDELKPGDLVEVVRASGTTGAGEAAARLTQGLVISIHKPDREELGGGASASADLLVPATVAAEVIDASSANLAGLALISRGNTTADVTLSRF